MEVKPRKDDNTRVKEKHFVPQRKIQMEHHVPAVQSQIPDEGEYRMSIYGDGSTDAKHQTEKSI